MLTLNKISSVHLLTARKCPVKTRIYNHLCKLLVWTTCTNVGTVCIYIVVSSKHNAECVAMISEVSVMQQLCLVSEVAMNSYANSGK